jgi:hypothetical protein
MGRQIGRHGFRGRGEGGYAPSVAPLPEDAEIGLVGLARAERLFGLGQMKGCSQVRARGNGIGGNRG